MSVDRFPCDADVERLLRQQYEPLCTDHDYQRLRRKCGLGPVIDGETITSSERTPTVPDQTALDLDQVRDHLEQWQARTALPPDAADRAAHTLAGHVPALLNALNTTRDETAGLEDQLGDIRATVSAAEATLDDARATLDRYREHSVTLNTISWKLAQALGDVPVGALQIDTNPVDNANRITRELAVTRQERDQARAELHAANRDLDHARREHDAARAKQGYAADYLTVDPDRESPATTHSEPEATCHRCGSPRWVPVSRDGGHTRQAQCVPCGAYRTLADRVTDAMAAGAAAGLAALRQEPAQ